MRILSIDTSGRFDSVSLVDGKRVLADLASEVRDNSLRSIVVNIDRVLHEASLALQDVDGFAVGIGPGSWTGVRVGITVGKILAFATNKPVLGVSSLDALAYQSRDVSLLLCPMVDAGRGNIYAAYYRPRMGTVVKEGEYAAGLVGGLLGAVREPVLFLGDGARLHRQAISAAMGPLASFGSSEERGIGRAVALLALARFERGESDDALAMVPLYLKEPLIRALAEQRGSGQVG
ncbi:MAG: tRNA (adenosine(37)-N6)-threonylcarbamoyltransferase complex dimerization subunit type 1 TsaB [Chloroflexi bacterium]|nr:tRNA (adenosine(37)-N6)-threonylcarbamoyltransferase complex dimerization subunit type 1 TsaB [Chloroflexota bacterium]